MALSNTQSQYGEITKIFHWLTAALILAIIPLGIMASNATFDTNEALANKAWLFSLHKTLGVAVFGVAVLRIMWAVTQKKPAPLHPDAKLETFLASVVHWLLYGSLVLAPLSGWIHHAATTGFAPIWWPLGQNLPLVPKSEAVAEITASLHVVWTKIMIGSILLHIAGALKHQIVDKDETLRRMWFGPIGSLKLRKPPRSYAAPAVAALSFAATGLATAATTPLEHEVAAQNVSEATLETTASEWTVQSGAISISVNQFGNDVAGNFNEWTSEIAFDPDTGLGTVETTIAIGSLMLGSVSDQAMGADFFDSANFPTAVYTADITPVDGGSYVAIGTLDLKGQTLSVELPFSIEFDGPTAAMTGNAVINRLDFGIGANMPDESNLGFEVSIDINLIAEFTPN